MSPKLPQKSGVQTGGVDIRTAGLEHRKTPIVPNTGDPKLKLGPVEASRFDSIGQFRPAVSRDVDRPAGSKKALFGKICRGPVEEGPRGGGELRDLGPTIALEPESGGSAGRVISAMRLRFEDQSPPLGRDLGAQAGPGDPAADDDDIEVRTEGHGAGYELESPTV